SPAPPPLPSPPPPTPQPSTLSLHDALPIFNGPDDTGRTPFLALAALDLPAPVSPEAFGRRAAPNLPSGFTLTQEGQAKIAGREEIGRAHVLTPVTWPSRMPSSA